MVVLSLFFVYSVGNEETAVAASGSFSVTDITLLQDKIIWYNVPYFDIGVYESPSGYGLTSIDANDDYLFALVRDAVRNKYAIYYSTDAINWLFLTYLPDPYSNATEYNYQANSGFDVDSDKIFVTVGNSSGFVILRYDLAAKTWNYQWLNTGVQTGMWHGVVKIPNGTLYLPTYGKKPAALIYKSTDDGKTWTLWKNFTAIDPNIDHIHSMIFVDDWNAFLIGLGDGHNNMTVIYLNGTYINNLNPTFDFIGVERVVKPLDFQVTKDYIYFVNDWTNEVPFYILSKEKNPKNYELKGHPFPHKKHFSFGWDSILDNYNQNIAYIITMSCAADTSPAVYVVKGKKWARVCWWNSSYITSDYIGFRQITSYKNKIIVNVGFYSLSYIVFQRLTPEEIDYLHYVEITNDGIPFEMEVDVPLYLPLQSVSLTFENSTPTFAYDVLEDFESGSLSEWSGNPATAYTVTNEESYNGTYCLKFNSTETTYYLKRTWVMSRPAGNYTLATIFKLMEHRRNVIAHELYIKLDLGLSDKTIKSEYIYCPRLAVGEWHPIILDDYINTGTATVVNVTVLISGYNCSWYLDSLTLIKIPSGYADNYKYRTHMFPALKNIITVNDTSVTTTFKTSGYIKTLRVVNLKYTILNITVSKQAVINANIPLRLENGIYYTPYGHDNAKITSARGNNLAILLQTKFTELSSFSFTDQRLHVVLEGPTGVTGTTVIYCPYDPILIFENGELKTTNYIWNSDTKLLTVNVTFSSPVNLDIYFAVPKLVSYDIRGEFLGYVFPGTQTVELNLKLYSESSQVSQDTRIILEVYNMDGALIYSTAKRETLTQQVKTVTFNIPDLEPGTYLIKVVLQNPDTGETLNTYSFLLKVTYPWWLWAAIIAIIIAIIGIAIMVGRGGKLFRFVSSLSVCRIK